MKVFQIIATAAALSQTTAVSVNSESGSYDDPVYRINMMLEKDLGRRVDIDVLGRCL